jgi:hypothetical protein
MVYAGPFADPASPFKAKFPLPMVTAHPGSNPAPPLLSVVKPGPVMVMSVGAIVPVELPLYATKVEAVPESEAIVNEKPEMFCPTVFGPASVLVSVRLNRLLLNVKSAFALMLTLGLPTLEFGAV